MRSGVKGENACQSDIFSLREGVTMGFIGFCKFIGISVVFFSYNWVLAATSARLTGQTGIITIASYQAGSGQVDIDAALLLEAMNVPVQNTFLGPGKAIVTPDRALNFICAERGAKGGPTCTIMINRGPHSELSQKRIFFRVQGEAANSLAQQMKLDGRGVYYFENLESTFAVSAKPNDFYVLYQESGIRNP